MSINQFGFTPCPKCGGMYRCEFNNLPNIIQCDDCGFAEPKKPGVNSIYGAVETKGSPQSS